MNGITHIHTRILGQVKHPHNTRLVIKDREINLTPLEAGRQFGLSRQDGWWKYWLQRKG